MGHAQFGLAQRLRTLDAPAMTPLTYVPQTQTVLTHVTASPSRLPVYRLAATIFTEAVAEYVEEQRFPHRARKPRSAHAWVASPEIKWPFSFVNLCALFDLDVEHVRRRLRRGQIGWIPRKLRG